jgi:hypothetical protein
MSTMASLAEVPPTAESAVHITILGPMSRVRREARDVSNGSLRDAHDVWIAAPEHDYLMPLLDRYIRYAPKAAGLVRKHNL